MARLPLLIVGLLRLCAANEAAEARPRQPALLLRGAVQFAAEAGAASASGAADSDGDLFGDGLLAQLASTGANTSLPPAGQAREDFVRRCTVALSARRQEMLPLDALQEFCGSTDAVVECKMRLVKKLKEVHKERGSIPAYCEMAYKWFQKKYGMLCPMQCKKLQCRSTCLWLEEKKKLQKRSKELKADELEASAAEDDMKDAAAALASAEDQVKAYTRAVNNSVRLVARAQDRLTEQEGWTQKAQGKVSQLKAKVTKLQDARTNSTARLRAYRSNLQKLHFTFDEARLQNGILRKRAERLEKKINQTVERAKDLPREIATRRAALEERFLAVQNMTDTLILIEDLVKDQEARLADSNKTFLKAKTMWLDAKAQGTLPKETIEDYESLTVQKKELMKEEALVLNKTKHYRNMLSAELQRSDEELLVLGDEADDLMGKAESAASEVDSLAGQLGQVKLEAKSLGKKNLTQSAVDASGVRRQMHRAAEEYIKVKKTLDVTKKYEIEESRKARKEEGRERKLRRALTDAQAKQTKAQDDLKKATKALEEATVKERYQRDKFRMLSVALKGNLEANQAAERQLQRMAPKIVRQHGLGLLQEIAAW